MSHRLPSIEETWARSRSCHLPNLISRSYHYSLHISQLQRPADGGMPLGSLGLHEGEIMKHTERSGWLMALVAAGVLTLGMACSGVIEASAAEAQTSQPNSPNNQTPHPNGPGGANPPNNQNPNDKPGSPNNPGGTDHPNKPAPNNPGGTNQPNNRHPNNPSSPSNKPSNPNNPSTPNAPGGGSGPGGSSGPGAAPGGRADLGVLTSQRFHRECVSGRSRDEDESLGSVGEEFTPFCVTGSISQE